MPRINLRWGLALLLIAAASINGAVRAEGLEGLDDPEGHMEAPKKASAASVIASSEEQQAEQAVDPAVAKQRQAEEEAALKAAHYAQVRQQATIGYLELGAVVFLSLYALNMLYGRAACAKIAAAWEKTYALEGQMFDKQFSVIGADGKGALMKEAANVYKFYASGRRHVSGLLATLNLKPRQDLLSSVWSLFSPMEDKVVVEAFMQESSMPQVVLAVGTPKCIRGLQKDSMDILKYTKRINSPGSVAGATGWPNDKLHVVAEHSTIFGELLGEQRVMQALNPNGPHAKALKYFRYMHFTSDDEGGHKRVLRFVFALPSPGAMADIAPLLALVPLLIDLVGTYKLSPDLKRKADATRAKVDADKEEDERKKRLEALAMRKMEKLAEEKARLARLPPMERQKAEEKLQKKQMEKQMRKRMVKVG